MFHRRFAVPFAVFAVAIPLLGGPVAAQDEQPGVFGEVLDVRVVNVEVVVTDKDGVRVPSLRPEDFTLEVDGREVPIEYFSEVLGGASVPPDAANAAVPALAPGEPVGTSYLLFVDDWFAIARDRNRILERIAEDLPELGPADRMAIVAFDGKGIEMLSSWSGSAPALARALDAARERPAYGLQRRAEQRTFEVSEGIRDPALISSALGTRLDLDEERRIDMVREQVRRAVLAGAAALRGFANPPGRKVMLLMSGGWPWNPTQWVIGDSTRTPFVRTGEFGDSLFGPLIETANRLGYTLYPIDVPGLLGDAIDITNASAEDTSARQRTELDRERDLEATLSLIAEATGGRPLLDGNSLDALARVVEDTRSYYWLGFTPDWQGDDSDHDIRVRTTRKGLKVRSRAGFSDLSRSNEVSMMVESTLLFGNAPSSAALQVRLSEPSKSGWGKVELDFEVLVPLDELTFLPSAEGQVAQAELRIAVLDEDGATADIPVVPLMFAAEELPPPGSMARYSNQVEMRRREHQMVFSLYDTASGKILSRTLTVGADW